MKPVPVPPRSENVTIRRRIGLGRVRRDLTAFRLVPPARSAKRMAAVMLLILVLLAAAFTLVPWVQTVSGQGRVIAFGPSDRSQDLESPLSGRVLRWLVTEGDDIEAGQALVEIADNDPKFTERLISQRDALVSKIEAQGEQLNAMESQIASLTSLRASAIEAQEAYVDQSVQKLRAAEQKLLAAEKQRQAAVLQRDRILRLAAEGLASQRDSDLAGVSAQKADADWQTARADVAAARRGVDAARVLRIQKASETDAKIQDIRSKMEKVRGEREDARGKLAEQEIKIARMGNRIVVAPRSGRLFKILAFEGPAQVKLGDSLAVIVPHTARRAVELWLDGNDAAWVGPDREVRLQFEGWPAIQFAGWPGASVGTFGGIVTFIDATDDGKGNFRILVEPKDDDAPWPDASRLRQGVRTKGWVLLDTVTLGFEAWRRLNGFPPQIEARKVPKLPKIKP